MSELTKEDIEQMRGVVRKCIFGIPDSEGRVARDTLDKIVDELLALRTLRDAGDEEVDKLFVNAMHAIGVDESVNPEGCKSSQRSLEELHCAAITRGQQLREAREEIERLKGCLKKSNDGFEEHERLWYLEQNKTETLTSELAALKSAPAMAEVDAAIETAIKQWKLRLQEIVDLFTDADIPESVEAEGGAS